MGSGLILIVESDHDSRVELRRVLEENGFLVVSAASSNQALEMLYSMTRPVAVFAMTFAESFVKAFKSHRDFANIPIVHSRFPGDHDMSYADYSIDRPINFQQVMSCLNQLLTRRNPQQRDA